MSSKSILFFPGYFKVQYSGFRILSLRFFGFRTLGVLGFGFGCGVLGFRVF